MIDISKHDKADVLAALYNASRPLGLGFLRFEATPMTREEASQLLEQSERKSFDYLKGRVMKVNLSDDSLEESLYDRDNGQGAALRAIQTIKQKD